MAGAKGKNGANHLTTRVCLACVLSPYHTVLAVKTLRAGSTPVLGEWRWKRQS
jgi:hypothetical protein